jgi:RimJ/RimL family protein N-acetyltransferase
VILRELTIWDLPFILDVRNNETTRANLENDSVFTLEQCANWFLDTKPNWYVIEIDENSVGYIRTKGDEVGIDIHPNYRRKGYAREAYKLYLKTKQYASLWVFVDNFAKTLYTELGFIETGNFKIIRNRKYIEMLWKNINPNSMERY